MDENLVVKRKTELEALIPAFARKITQDQQELLKLQGEHRALCNLLNPPNNEGPEE